MVKWKYGKGWEVFIFVLYYERGKLLDKLMCSLLHYFESSKVPISSVKMKNGLNALSGLDGTRLLFMPQSSFSVLL